MLIVARLLHNCGESRRKVKIERRGLGRDSELLVRELEEDLLAFFGFCVAFFVIVVVVI